MAKKFRTKAKFHVFFNDVQVQCSVCIAVAFRLLDMCGKLPGTLLTYNPVVSVKTGNQYITIIAFLNVQ